MCFTSVYIRVEPLFPFDLISNEIRAGCNLFYVLRWMSKFNVYSRGDALIALDLHKINFDEHHRRPEP